MFLSFTFNRTGLAVAALVVALMIACDGDSGDAKTPEWAIDAVPAPSHLLLRTPFFADQPIPREEFESIDIEPNIYGPEAMEPGQSFRYALGVFQCCVVLRPVDIPVAWSVEPPGIARIDGDTGFLATNRAAAHGSKFNITALVEGMDEPVTREMAVFSREQNPLIGRWHENREQGGVRELLFQSDGRYFATWFLLESRVDLVGDYTVAPSTGEIELTKDWEMEETQGFQGTGSFEIDDQGQLLLTGICPSEPDPENPTCSRRFTRSR